MELCAEGIQRRVSSRKRSADHLVKTKSSKKSKCLPQMQDITSMTKSEKDGWIKNSFILCQGSEPGQQCSRLTSTPKSICKKQSKSSIIPTSPETYLTQHHQSFNEDDSIFADLDHGGGEQDIHSIQKMSIGSSKSMRKELHTKSQDITSSCMEQSVPSVTPKRDLVSATKKRIEFSEQHSYTSKLWNIDTFGSDNSLFADEMLIDTGDKKPSSIKQSLASKTISQTQSEGSQFFEKVHAHDDSALPVKNVCDAEIKNRQSRNHSDPGTSTPSQIKRRSLEFQTLSGSQLIVDNVEDDQKVCGTDDQNLCDSRLVLSSEAEKVSVAVSANLKTPVTTRSGSVKNRIRKTLSDNVHTVTPVTSRTAKLKAQSLEKALKAAEELKQEGTKYDIGPFYGLPSKVADLLEAQRGIKQLYGWQDECLSLEAVRESRNLIYSLPTSGGKTLVAEVLILRELLCKKRDALLVLPFVAIVQEKVKSLSPFALEMDFTVEEYAASKGQIPPRKRQRRNAIYIATIEKANSLVNSLVEAGRIQEIGLVVVDELHMLGEGGSRGAILEIALTKLMHVSGGIQIIGMSATLNNIEDLSKFLKADVYSNDFRPVELREYVKMEDVIYEINGQALCPQDQLKHSRVCTFKYDSTKNRADPDHLAGLVREVIPKHSCLVFCPTKKNCENVATLLCKMLPKDFLEVKREARHGLLKMLWHEGNGQVCPVLRQTVPYGIAYHHSGLTMDERRLIEEAYLDGTLCLLACTSTLAAGVNLPAKRVILRSPNVGLAFLSRSQYKQMVGRAGRAGLDSSGESILILQKKDKLKLMDLVTGPCDFCRSSLLYEDNKGMRRLLLTTIGLKMTPTLLSVSTFLQRTLCHIQMNAMATDMMDVAQNSLQQLLDLGLINQTVSKSLEGQELKLEDYTLSVTKLGQAVFKGSVDIDRGPQLYQDLCQAQESLVVANYLHLLYLVTPYDMVGTVKPDWMIYLNQMSNLESHELKVATLIGVPESYIVKRASGQRIRKTVDEFNVNRFYITLILYNLWKQQSIWDVAARFQQPRGLIQNLLNGASTFAACIAHFCEELEEFWAYQDLFTNFTKKLSYCFMMDLIPLMEIPGVKTGRARQLYSAGFRNLGQVAHSDPKRLCGAISHLNLKMANNIIIAAKVLLNDKVEALQEEAEQMSTTPTEMPLTSKSVAKTNELDTSPDSRVPSKASQSSTM